MRSCWYFLGFLISVFSRPITWIYFKSWIPNTQHTSFQGFIWNNPNRFVLKKKMHRYNLKWVRSWNETVILQQLCLFWQVSLFKEHFLNISWFLEIWIYCTGYFPCFSIKSSKKEGKKTRQRHKIKILLSWNLKTKKYTVIYISQKS